MILNKLKVNDGQTELMIIVPKQHQAKLAGLKLSITIGQSVIEPNQSVRDLGAILNSSMDMVPQVTQVVRSMYMHMRRIGKIRFLLNNATCATLIQSLVISGLDFHNALLANVPKATIAPLQLAQNTAARLVSRSRRHEHITPVLHDLHWLPVHKRIQYKVLCMVYKVLVVPTSPTYLRDMLEIYSPNRALRSLQSTMPLVQPRTSRKVGERAFSIYGPQLWNSIPDSLRASPSIDTFKANLKTYLFKL